MLMKRCALRDKQCKYVHEFSEPCRTPTSPGMSPTPGPVWTFSLTFQPGPTDSAIRYRTNNELLCANGSFVSVLYVSSYSHILIK